MPLLDRAALPLSFTLLAILLMGCSEEGEFAYPEEEEIGGRNCNCNCNCLCDPAATGSTGSISLGGMSAGGRGNGGTSTGGAGARGGNSPLGGSNTSGGGWTSTGSTASGGDSTASGSTSGASGGSTGRGGSSGSSGSTSSGGDSPSDGGTGSTGTAETGGASTDGTPFIIPDDAQPTPESSGIPGLFRVNSSGQVTASGTPFQIRGGNWFGLEGQDDNARPGAMELYIGSVFWADASNKRAIAETMQEITASPLSFNTVRLPIAPQCLVPGHEDGDYTRTDAKIRNNDPELYPYADCRAALEDFIEQADANNLYVILDIHSCSNHIGWRAGMIHDGPPWTDADRENYEYKKENYTCRSGEDEYTVEKWLADIHTLARLPKDLGVDNVLGIDCFNEPFKYTWSQWADLAKQCYDAMASENDDLIAFVEGVSGSWEDEQGNKGPEPYGDTTTNPNWGENLYGQQFDPIQIPRDRLCFAPHTYGPSVYVQRQFIDQSDPECVGLEDDAAGKAGCRLVVERTNSEVVEKMRKGWDARFGYLVEQNYCVMIGEFGGYKTWPDNPVDPNGKTIWAHLPSGVRYDWEWQTIFVEYLKDKGLTNFTYWSINPESGDTGGIYNHAYTESNESGWGVWQGLDADKTALLGGLR